MTRGALRSGAVVLALTVALTGCGRAEDRPVTAPSRSGDVPSDTTSPSASATASRPVTPSSSPVPTGSPSRSPTTAPTPSATPAGCRLPDGLLARDVERLPLAGRAVALTFDGGSNAAGVPPILETLDAQEVPATFFLTGAFARAFPTMAARISSRHVVGNHTETHPDLTTLPDAQVAAEVGRGEATVRQVTGVDPRPFFRFPFGARTEHTIAVLNELCYVPFRWTIDTLGWKGTSGGQSVGSVTARVLDGAAPGAVVLMHVGANPDDGSTLDADALPGVIRGLRAAGYRFVSLSDVVPDRP